MLIDTENSPPSSQGQKELEKWGEGNQKVKRKIDKYIWCLIEQHQKIDYHCLVIC